MKHFKQFRTATESSKSLTFDLIENERGKGSFTVTGKTKKKASGTFSFSDDGLHLNVVSSDYAGKYLKKLIRTELKGGATEGLTIALNTPQKGSTIATKQFLDQLDPGDKVTLAIGTYYYSLDSDVVVCNGWPLRKNYRAVFRRQVLAKCSPNTASLKYSLFVLL